MSLSNTFHNSSFMTSLMDLLNTENHNMHLSVHFSVHFISLTLSQTTWRHTEMQIANWISNSDLFCS